MERGNPTISQNIALVRDLGGKRSAIILAAQILDDAGGDDLL